MKRFWHIPTEKTISSKNRRSNNTSEGFVLPMVLIIAALIFSIGGIALLSARNQLEDNNKYLSYEICELTARNALEICQSELIADPLYTGTNGIQTTSNGATYSINVVKQSDTLYFIELNAKYQQYQNNFTGTMTLNDDGTRIEAVSVKQE